MILAVLFCVLAFVVVAGLGVCMPLSRATRVTYGSTAVLCLLLFLLSIASILRPTVSIAFPLGPPGMDVHLLLDPLAAIFLSLINLGSLCISIYAIGYGQHEAEPRRVLSFFPLFLAAMNLVVIAADAYSFLFAWELMSVASWALVMSNHRESQTAAAGYLYLLMASGGTLALILAFGMLGSFASSSSFVVMAAHPPPREAAAVVLLLVYLGAGSKAGLIPLHAWLPLAHPSAPSHVSALMSAVMTKVAIYAFIRIAFDLLGPPAWWWGTPALLFGSLTVVMGMLYALMETDLKRILAYSTIENIGLIFVALGLALSFSGSGLLAAAATALVAALLHAANHMLFKSVLFFGAGAVLTATGERDIEKLGGLIHCMPRSSTAFLVASLAISALPPLNGFASEWLIFQSVLLSPHLNRMSVRLLVPAVGVLLALAAALAAACFVRAFGVTYLGRPRTAAAAEARETDNWSTAAMMGGAALCVLSGLFPGFIIDWLRPVTESLLGSHMPLQATNSWLSIVPISASRSSYNALIIAVFLLASGSLTSALIHRFASRVIRRAPAWNCGYPDPSPITQYSATSLAQPIRRVFGTFVFKAHSSVYMPPPGGIAAATFRQSRRDPIWVFAYLPLSRVVQFVAAYLNPFQFLTIRTYLSFVFATLILLLVLLAVWG